MRTYISTFTNDSKYIIFGMGPYRLDLKKTRILLTNESGGTKWRKQAYYGKHFECCLNLRRI